MSLLDFNCRLTPTAQAFAATAVATDSYPLTQAGRDIGIGEPMAIVFTPTVSAAVAGSETYEFQVVTATASNGTSGQVVIASSGTYTVSGGSIAVGSLAVGNAVVVPVPPDRILSTATHITGKVVIGASGAITCLVELVPLRLAYKKVKAYTGKPDFAA